MGRKKKNLAEKQAGYLNQASEESKYYLELTKKSEAFKACKPRERLFVVNYVLYNADVPKAMVMSGCTSKYYSQLGSKWMKKETIQQAIHEFWEIVFKDKISRIERMLVDHLYRRAFSSRAKYFTKDGALKPGLTLEDLGEDECIIDGIEKKYYGKEADVCVTIYKIADRNQAYTQLQKILGLDINRISVSTDQKTTGVLKVPEMITKEEWRNLN